MLKGDKMRCIMAQSAWGCNDEATWYEEFKNPYTKEPKRLYYCSRHKKEGCEFGWLEVDELKQINTEATK